MQKLLHIHVLKISTSENTEKENETHCYIFNFYLQETASFLLYILDGNYFLLNAQNLWGKITLLWKLHVRKVNKCILKWSLSDIQTASRDSNFIKSNWHNSYWKWAPWVFAVFTIYSSLKEELVFKTAINITEKMYKILC